MTESFRAADTTTARAAEASAQRTGWEQYATGFARLAVLRADEHERLVRRRRALDEAAAELAELRARQGENEQRFADAAGLLRVRPVNLRPDEAYPDASPSDAAARAGWLLQRSAEALDGAVYRAQYARFLPRLPDSVRNFLVYLPFFLASVAIQVYLFVSDAPFGMLTLALICLPLLAFLGGYALSGLLGSRRIREVKPWRSPKLAFYLNYLPLPILILAIIFKATS